METNWVGKKVLCVGDSLTQAGLWQAQLQKNLGCDITAHCMGGFGLKEVIDGGESPVGKLPPLSLEEVKDIDVLIFFAGYNNRDLLVGTPEDDYDPKKQKTPTFAGLFRYCLEKIYQLLKAADNLQCRLLIVTPHCVGKYSYIEVDGDHEYPKGSQQTLKTLTDMMEEIANAYHLPCCNLFKKSGINAFTWQVYGANPGSDEVHCSPLGYRLLGDVITGSLISHFGL